MLLLDWKDVDGVRKEGGVGRVVVGLEQKWSRW